MLRRYIVLPPILLALGVGDASAMTCSVSSPQGANLWKEENYKAGNELCFFKTGYQFYPFRQLPPDPKLHNSNFVEVTVVNDKPNSQISCPKKKANERVTGFVSEYRWSDDAKNLLQVSNCY